MGFLKKLEKFDKRIKELQKIEEKRVKEEQRARIKEGTEGKYQAQITYTLVVLLTLIPFSRPSSPRYAPHSHEAIAVCTGAFVCATPITPYPKNTSGRM